MIEEVASALPALKAMAHESRLRLLALIAEKERSVQDIAALLGLREPTVSHHLSMLWGAGLVRMRKEGNVHWYALEATALQRLGRSIASREALPPVAGADDARIVANYLDAEGRLKAFPASRKKRRQILVWLARQFAEGRVYREAEINAVIEKRHHDFETFRRELVGYKMLARKAGSYWRLPEAEWAA
jgi:DNA-binding transcriptional ArsR family regulator